MNERMTGISQYLGRSTKVWVLVVAIVGSLVVGYAINGMFATDGGVSGGTHVDGADANADKAPEIWTCSMHPHIKKPKPGLCPICNMQLIPLETSTDDAGGPRELTVSQSAKKLMDIETSPVERRFVDVEVRMVGKIDYDETRLKYITAWVAGRLDRLYVDYTGVTVNKGDHLADLYSPDLISAQEELLQALKSAKTMAKSDIASMRESAQATVEAAREKLRLWGLKPEQVAAIETRGKASDHVTIHAPSGGVVIHKNAQEGLYVKTGTRIYTIADLSEVWIRLDAYESDLVWLRYGQNVEFTTEAYPGRTFTGTIAFIDPILTEMTRTVKLRINAPNPEMLLKPGMFVRAIVKAHIAGEGKVMDTSLAGKWICPMHPDVVKEIAGKCDICQMPLVRTETLGYLNINSANAKKPLVIPASAALITGTRAIVYVEVPDREKPTFEGREIVLGPRAGDYYIVLSGLEEGQRVVTRGAFKIDAELQIQAKPSMMTPEPPAHSGEHRSALKATPGIEHEARPQIAPEFRKQLAKAVERYLAIQQALAGDDYPKAIEAAKATTAAVASVDMALVQGDDHMAWMKSSAKITNSLKTIASADGIEPVRAEFATLSDEMTTAAKRFGVAGISLYQFKCSMALGNRGAIWLQSDKETRNPYFGSSMLGCGEVTEVLPGIDLAGDSNE